MGLEASLASGNRAAASSSSDSVLGRSDETSSGKLGQESWESDKKDENDPLADLLFWLEDFTDNLILTEVFAPAHISQDSNSEHSTKVASRKHIFFTHFPKDRNCDVCLRTKITKASCTRRTGEALPRAEKFGDLLTADHKVLNEGCESGDNHQNAVVVQDLATQRMQSYPCKTKSAHETEEGSPGRNAIGFGMSLRWVVSWLKKGLWILAKKRMLEDRGCLPRKDGDVLREENFLGSWLREDEEGKEKERERENVNKAAKEEERKRVKREVEGERERVETKRICLDRVSSKVFEVLCPNSEVESVGNSWVHRCVSTCGAADFLSRKSEASLALEGETEMNREGPLAEAEPGAIRSRPAP